MWEVRSKSVGMEGPKMSVSRMPARRPRRARARERLAVEERLMLGEDKECQKRVKIRRTGDGALAYTTLG